MREIIWSKTFKRTFKKNIKKYSSLDKEIEKTLKLLSDNPFVPQLETHKLKGKLTGSWACSAGYDLRIIFDFVKNESGAEEDIFLLGIGTHDEVY